MHQKNVSFVTIWFLKMLGLSLKSIFIDLLTMAYSLKNIAILSATLRCLLVGTSKNEALKKLNNSVTYDRGVLQIWILVQIKH